MKTLWKNNALSLVLFALFALFIIGQSITGLQVYNEEQLEHGQALISYGPYLVNGHFIEAVFENWESEFLQMGVYILLTIYLRQQGAAESKKYGEKEAVDRKIPGKGSWKHVVYRNSLSIGLISLFVLSFILHAAGGSVAYSEEQQAHGGEAISVLQYMATSQFWFESFQNWQSEFLSLGVLLVFSIYLRQLGSPQSKPIDAPHEQTGGE